MVIRKGGGGGGLVIKFTERKVELTRVNDGASQKVDKMWEGVHFYFVKHVCLEDVNLLETKKSYNPVNGAAKCQNIIPHYFSDCTVTLVFNFLT